MGKESIIRGWHKLSPKQNNTTPKRLKKQCRRINTKDDRVQPILLRQLSIASNLRKERRTRHCQRKLTKWNWSDEEGTGKLGNQVSSAF